ncbi:MAG: glycosyltransferase family 4 protein [Rubripirellula sp.]
MITSDFHSVLLIGNFLSANVGNFSVCEDLAKKLRDEGLDVATASDHKARLPRLFDIVSTTWRQRNHYDLASVDVYSGLAFGLAEAACYTLRAAKKPYVLTLRGGNLPSFAKRWPRRVERLFRNAAVVITPSSYLQEHLQHIHDDIRLLPNPLHLERYNYRHREEVQPNLIWVRSFHSVYNPSMAPRVVAKLATDFPNIKLTMVGPDKRDGSFEETQKVAQELGVTQRIHFTGGIRKEAVPDELSKADILINTTNIDNTPTTVLEAMACGLCVVSTNVGGIPHLLTHENNGLLVKPRNVNAMSEAVARVLSDRELTSNLSENARQYTAQFDWNTLLPRWIELLKQVQSSHEAHPSD